MALDLPSGHADPSVKKVHGDVRFRHRPLLVLISLASLTVLPSSPRSRR
jgi:hypothetical protein